MSTDPTEDNTLNSNYLEQAMYPSEKMPAYAHISSKLQASHYAAVEASTQLGKNIIDIVKKLKIQQSYYFDVKDFFDQDTKDGLENILKDFVVALQNNVKRFKKKYPEKYVKEITDIRLKYFKDKNLYLETRKKAAKQNYLIYFETIQDIASDVKAEILSSYEMHVLYQYTHGVSVKGQGRKGAFGLGLSKTPGGTPLKEHKRSRTDKLFGRNKEPGLMEVGKNG